MWTSPFPFIRRMLYFKLSGEYLNANFVKKATWVGERHSSYSANQSPLPNYQVSFLFFLSSFLRLSLCINIV